MYFNINKKKDQQQQNNLIKKLNIGINIKQTKYKLFLLKLLATKEINMF